MKMVKHVAISHYREKEAKRKAYSVLLDRVFLSEEVYQDKNIYKTDLDAMEKELSIDIAELRRDFRTVTSEIQSTLEAFENDRTKELNNVSDPTTAFKSDKENNISVNRNSSRHRKKSILNEASYLAHRLSRALSHSGLSDDEETKETMNITEGTGTGKNILLGTLQVPLLVTLTFFKNNQITAIITTIIFWQ